MSGLTEQQFLPPSESESSTPAASVPADAATEATTDATTGVNAAPAAPAAPSTSPPSATNSPSAKRTRIARSCDQCHGRSMRCQGFKPCYNCTKRGKTCTYDRPSRRGPARTPPPPPDNPDPNARNLTNLRDPSIPYWHDKSWAVRSCDRCRTLRERCKGRIPCDACFEKRVECTYNMRAAQKAGQAPLQLFGARDARMASGSFLDAPQELNAEGVSDDTSYQAFAEAGLARVAPDVAPLQIATRYSHEDTPPLVFLHRAWQKIAHALERANQPAAEREEPNQPVLAVGDQPFDTSKPFQFPDTLAKWIEMQKSFQMGWTETFHFLHRATARSWLEKVFKNMTDRAPLERDVGHAKAAIAIMTMALGSLFYVRPWNPSKRDQQWSWIWTLGTGDQLFLVSLRLTDQETGLPALDSVQARLLQALYLLCTCRINLACSVFNNAVHIVTSLGLHRRRGRNRGLGPDIVLHPDYAKIQCERRTFWSAYLLDKQIAMMTGRPRYFNGDLVDQELPDGVNDEDMHPAGPFRPHKGDCYMDALVEQIKLTRLTDRLLSEVYSLRDIPEDERLARAWQIGEQIEQWHASLPFLLGSIKTDLLHLTFRRQATLMHLAYRHAQILAYRPFMTAEYPLDLAKKRVADSAIRACIEAARATITTAADLARQQVDRDKSQFRTILYTHHVTFCAVSVLLLIPQVRERQARFPPPNYKKPIADDRFVILADKGIKALADSTYEHSPARKWVIILNEMRDEAARQARRTNSENRDQKPERDPGNDSQSPGQQNPGSNIESPAQQLLEDALRAHWEADLSAETPANNNNNSNDNDNGPSEASPVYLPKLWDKWMITDWVDLDSAAFGPISNFKFGDLPIAPRPPIPPQ